MDRIPSTLKSYNPKDDNVQASLTIKDLVARNPSLKAFLAGSLSGTISTLLFQPLEIAKTRLQNESFGSQRMTTLMMGIARNEGITGLWCGTVPSLIRCVPGVGVYFCSINALQNVICGPNKSPGPLEAAFIGISARCIGATMLMPFTVIKTRYESGVYKYKSVSYALLSTYNQSGVRALYSGLWATICRDAPYSGLYFALYSQLKEKATGLGPGQVISKTEHSSSGNNQNPVQYLFMREFSCAIVAGLLASLITHPVDVIKTAMQLHTSKYGTFSGTAVLIAKEEGAKGFTRGLLPRVLRRTMMTSLAWTVYENMIRLIGID